MPMSDVYGSTNLLGSGLLNTNFGFNLTGPHIPPPTTSMELKELQELKEPSVTHPSAEVEIVSSRVALQ
ncbi:unnamed protein product [Durusdinium trenchii]|uniref:Uncharacterized protein n=1 Tax=Durusdinium trenchii TaxID=1381693 RepID=A0ABP0S984_9DINO